MSSGPSANRDRRTILVSETVKARGAAMHRGAPSVCPGGEGVAWERTTRQIRAKGFAQFLGGIGRSLVANRSLEFPVTLRHPTPGADHLLGDVVFKDHLRWDIATAALRGSICHSHSLMISQICTQTATALSRCPRTEKEACSRLFRNERDRRQSPDEPELPTPCSAQP